VFSSLASKQFCCLKENLAMAMAMASSLLQDRLTSTAFCGTGRNVSSSSSQIRHGAGVLRKAFRVPALSGSDDEFRLSASKNVTCNVRGSKVQQLNAVADAVSQTSDLDLQEGIDWDNLGFGLRPTDFMYVMKGDLQGNWSEGELQPYGNMQISPSAGVLNYGQGIFEGLKAYRTADDRILMFRPEENALRMLEGSERMSMPAPDADMFVNAVKQTVLANKRWIPPAGKGSLYIRPLLIGTGAILGLAPAPEYTFLIYVSPVGAYFKGGLLPIDLKVETHFHRAAPGGTGGVKTISNYAPVLKTQLTAKGKGYSDVIYLDAVENKYVEEVSSCNIFMVKDKVISTPELIGTILPGITRKSVIQLARSRGYEVNERPVAVDELLSADEVFCTGTAVVLNPVGTITHGESRVQYNGGGVGAVSQELYEALTSIQMGVSHDKFDWVVEVA